MNSRYYDPETGRFLNADGYIIAGQDKNSYNMFAYCGNNWINRIDSTGMFWSSVKKVVSKAWNKVKTWVKNTFTADVKTSTEIPIIDIGENINITVGIRETATTENNHNTFKPISIYSNAENSAEIGTSAGVGIKSNILNTDVNISTKGVSYSKTNKVLFTEISTAYAVTWTGRIECEYGATISWNNVEYTGYISESTIWQFPALALAVATGKWEALPSLIPSLQLQK